MLNWFQHPSGGVWTLKQVQGDVDCSHLRPQN
jgi:hypothetical protein